MLKFWKSKIVARSGVTKPNWLEIAETTITNRRYFGFHSDNCAQEMAHAAESVVASGGSIGEAIDAAETAYKGNFFYSTPDEYPCDEWRPYDILRAA